MRSTFHGLEVAKRGLSAQQAALNTMSHNVANANTEGYSRQVVDMSAFSPLAYPAMSRGTEAGQLGQGVNVDSIRRMRNSFLDAQYRGENSTTGQWEINKQALDKIQAVINEPSNSGLSKVITEFFNSWQDLSATPESITARQAVRENGVSLANTFKHLDTQLQTLDKDLQQSISVNIDEINATLDSIKEINKQIKVVETLGDNANDLRDKRDLLVDKMSKIVNVTVKESPAYTLSIGKQDVLVGSNDPLHLSYNPAATSPTPSFSFAAAGTNNPPAVTTANADAEITNGELKGLTNSRINYVAAYRQELDALSSAVVTEVNKIHTTGTDLNGKNPADPFFTGSTAGTIAVNATIISDESKIASSSNKTKGNNDIARKIGDLINTQITFGPSSPLKSPGTFEDYFQAMVGQLGIQGRHADRMNLNESALTSQINNQRQSISGVSIDEEMANMIKFQQAYNASARVVTMVDSILDKVINGMGLTR